MDMLTVGMYGQGNVGKDHLMTNEEYITQFSAWCMMGSPLMIGCDIRHMSEEARTIYQNAEAIAIDQDPAYRQVFRIPSQYSRHNPDCRIYVRFLEGGDLAIGFFNLGEAAADIGFNLDLVGLNRTTGKSLRMHDVWSGEDFTVKNEIFGKGVPAHGCKLYRATLIDA